MCLLLRSICTASFFSAYLDQIWQICHVAFLYIPSEGFLQRDRATPTNTVTGGFRNCWFDIRPHRRTDHSIVCARRRRCADHLIHRSFGQRETLPSNSISTVQPFCRSCPTKGPRTELSHPTNSLTAAENGRYSRHVYDMFTTRYRNYARRKYTKHHRKAEYKPRHIRKKHRVGYRPAVFKLF